jgi:hypothetical protein
MTLVRRSEGDVPGAQWAGIDRAARRQMLNALKGLSKHKRPTEC